MTDAHGTPLEAEPKTPMWLPALGATLFVAVALWWAVTPSAPTIIADDTAPSASASVAAAPSPAPAPPPPAQLMPGNAPAALPGQLVPAGAGSGKRLNPAIEDRLRKAHEGMPAPGGPGRHP